MKLKQQRLISKVILTLVNLSIEEMINYFKQMSDFGVFSGLNLIINNYCIHVLECEASVMLNILKALNETANLSGSIYS